MDIIIDVFIVISDFILGIFSGNEWKKLIKLIKKSE